jgi:hypothetical protein
MQDLTMAGWEEPLLTAATSGSRMVAGEELEASCYADSAQ